jgi:hypothetical protein
MPVVVAVVIVHLILAQAVMVVQVVAVTVREQIMYLLLGHLTPVVVAVAVDLEVGIIARLLVVQEL